MKNPKKFMSGLAVLTLSFSAFACSNLPRLTYTDMTILCIDHSQMVPEISEDNEIKKLIEQKTGVRLEETVLDDRVEAEIEHMIDDDTLPDLIFSDCICAGESLEDFYDMGILVAWDEYLEKYPNLKGMYTDEEWDAFRQEDGKIYWSGIYGDYYGNDTTPTCSDFYFAIQARVLEAYDYPEIKTLDDYFDILERFSRDYPTMPDGSDVIAYTCICEDFRYYCLERAPVLLDGYPYDSCIVNIDNGTLNPTVVDYNVTPTAEAYFRKLHEEYINGYMDPDFATMTFDEYLDKLSTGRVLGLAEFMANLSYYVMDAFSEERTSADGTIYTLSELGCDYVPLALTIDEGITPHHRTSQWYSNYGYSGLAYGTNGIAVTTSCEDPDKAFAYLNDLLSQDIHDLRYWGIEGVDYLVDSETGLFYRTEEMRANWNDAEYLSSHACQYQYMLQMSGMSHDGINRMLPQEQPSEFIATLSEPLQNCLRAYDADNFVEFLGSVECEPYPWFPVADNYFINTLQGDPLDAYADSRAVMHEWLPIVITSADFDTAWSQYTDAYNAANPQIYFDYMQEDLDYRIERMIEYYGWEG